MKVKRVKIGVRPPGTIFDEATDVREMGKVLTPRRLELLKAIHDHQPDSIRALATVASRNVKNVAEDLGLLVSLGLVEMESGANRKKAPRVEYETLTIEVHL